MGLLGPMLTHQPKNCLRRRKFLIFDHHILSSYPIYQIPRRLSRIVQTQVTPWVIFHKDSPSALHKLPNLGQPGEEEEEGFKLAWVVVRGLEEPH